MNRMLQRAGALVGLAALALPGVCQEMPEVVQEATGAVIKGKAPVAREVLRVRFPKPKLLKLANGLAVYLLEDHRTPSIRLNMSLRAGGFYEPKPGVASVTASMLTEAVGNRDSKQLADLTEGLGLQLGASSGPIQASVSCSGLSENTDVLIGLMADALLRPAFPQERLDRLQQNERSQSGQRRTNPTGLMTGLQARVFYKGTPLQRVAPKPEELRAIKRDDIVAYHAAFYRPNGAILGVTGDIRAGELKSKLEKALADWRPAETTPAPPSITVAPKEKTTIYLVDRPGSTQTVLGFGNIAIARNHPDYVPLVLANRILGGGSAARLFQNIRERKGYTYGAYSALSATQYTGTWTAGASVRTEVTAPAAQEFLNEFARLQDEPVSDKELAQAKTSIVGGFALTLESPDGILGRSLELVNNGLPANYWDTYPAKVQAVTPADIQRVARAYLGKGRVQVFAVGERSEIEAGLAKLGPVEVVDAAQLSTPAGPGGGRRGP